MLNFVAQHQVDDKLSLLLAIAGRSPAFMARRTASQQRSSISHSTHNSSQTTTATSSAAAASLNGAVAASERSATTATSASTSTATNSNNTAAVNSPIPLNQTPTGSGRRRAPPPPPPAALAAALHAHRNGRVASGAPMPIPGRHFVCSDIASSSAFLPLQTPTALCHSHRHAIGTHSMTTSRPPHQLQRQAPHRAAAPFLPNLQ